MPLAHRLSVAPLLLLTTGCLPDSDAADDSGCSPFAPGCAGSRDWGSVTSSSAAEDAEAPREVGPFSGTGEIDIIAADCNIIWDISGPQCAGCDLGWDVALTPSGGTCSADPNAEGRLQYADGSVYFDDFYWGYGVTGGGTLRWYSLGYVYGAGGYDYYYSGSGSY